MSPSPISIEYYHTRPFPVPAAISIPILMDTDETLGQGGNIHSPRAPVIFFCAPPTTLHQ